MRCRTWVAVLGLSLACTVPSSAEITKGVLAIKGAQMSWWGGMARDAISRQYDVDANSVKLSPLAKDLPKDGYPPGKIHFVAKPGKSIDLDKISESIAATRLSGGTNMGMEYLEITAKGEVLARDKDLALKVSGTGQEFVLAEDASAKEALQRLRQAIGRGDKVTAITGRVQGWSGRFPDVLAAWAKSAGQKRTLSVTDFEISK